MKKLTKLHNFAIKYQYTFGAYVLIVLSILLAVFVFSGAYVDLAKSGKLAWQYIVHFFNTLTNNTPTDSPAPPTPPPTPLPPDIKPPIIPDNPNILVAQLKIWGLMLVSGQSYQFFIYWLLMFVMQATTWLLMLVPLAIIFAKFVQKAYFKPNTNHGQNTKSLDMYLKFSQYTVTPITTYIKGLFEYLKVCKIEKALLIIIWLLNLNVFSIILPFIPFYFYFCISFDFKALYEMLKFVVFSLKYIAILSPFVLVPIFLLIFDKWRLKHATRRLQKFEEYNQSVLASRDISTFKWGTMGTRKTMTLTDEALSISVMDTNKAEELKGVCRKMFIYFPWLEFEFDIENQIKNATIYNWASCLDYVAELEKKYKQNEFDLYGYNVEKYGLEYYNGIAVNNLFKVLADYARLHFLYVCNSSFIISNYAIREDKQAYTLGNTILWDCDFFNFNKDVKDSYFSKILDFDLLRMGRRIHDDASNDALEFGIICIAEADKEQMNAVETIKDSTESPYPNPKNDGITRTEKFIRHRATIMGYCFAHILKDGQRVMSINADTRELCTLEHMLKPSREKNTLPFFSFEKSINYFASKIFDNFDEKIRYYRGDNTLLHYFLKFFNKKLYDFYYTRKNRYGYVIISKAVESGTLDNNISVIKMYQCNAKVYSDRYRTDSHAKFFEDKARASHRGIINFESYGSTTMSDQEFAKQNSYSRLNMVNPDWKQPYIDKANEEKELKKAEAKKMAKELAKME